MKKQREGDANLVRASQSTEPTTFELAKITAILATAERFKNSSIPDDLVASAIEIWEACDKVQVLEKEKRILISTVAKIRDTEMVFGVIAKPTKKGNCGSITTEQWLQRAINFQGHKYHLFLDLLYTAVPEDVLTKELFPLAGKSRRKLMMDLVRRETKSSAAWFLKGLARCLTLSAPEPGRELLLAAIRTGDPQQVEEWLVGAGLAHPKDFSPVYELFQALKDMKEGKELFFPSAQVPALLCRWLILVYERNISKVRSNASRKRNKRRGRKANNSSQKATKL